MRTLRLAAVATYAVAGILIVFPLIDFATLATPFRFGDVAWRFAAEGSLSKALLIPFIGLLVALIAAIVFEQRFVLRAIAVTTAVLGVCLVGIAVLFALDALQIRGQMRPEIKSAFEIGTLVALGKHAVYVAVLFAIGLASWKSGKRTTTAARSIRNAPPLVVREPGHATPTGNTR